LYNHGGSSPGLNFISPVSPQYLHFIAVDRPAGTRWRDDRCLAARKGDASHLRTEVENAISPLLPHGRVPVENVARDLGMSRRTLARKLSDEGLNFTDILQQLRHERRAGKRQRASATILRMGL
jgi:AraC-like DNA-binding protein